MNWILRKELPSRKPNKALLCVKHIEIQNKAWREENTFLCLACNPLNLCMRSRIPCCTGLFPSKSSVCLRHSCRSICNSLSRWRKVYQVAFVLPVEWMISLGSEFTFLFSPFAIVTTVDDLSQSYKHFINYLIRDSCTSLSLLKKNIFLCKAFNPFPFK